MIVIFSSVCSNELVLQPPTVTCCHVDHAGTRHVGGSDTPLPQRRVGPLSGGSSVFQPTGRGLFPTVNNVFVFNSHRAGALYKLWSQSPPCASWRHLAGPHSSAAHSLLHFVGLPVFSSASSDLIPHRCITQHLWFPLL